MKRNKTGSIIILMIASCLLLTVFIGRWLQTEYNSAKMELSKDLFTQFINAQSRVTDTLLAQKFITPLLSDTNGFKINTISKRGIGFGTDTVQITSSSTIGDSIPAILEFTGLQDADVTENIHLEVTNDSSDLLVQGVKLFITEISGKGGEHAFFREMITSEDTLMLQSYFQQNLDSNGYNVEPVWVHNRKSKMFPPPPFYYESHMLATPFGVEIQGYNNYIFKNLLPEFIFGILLITIITFAFIFSYRNIRSQMRLAELKDDLISNISHELKTPVATVKVAIEAMQQMDPVEKKDKIANYLEMAKQETNRLDQLVNKVMNSILLDNGKQVFQQEEINILFILEEAIAGMQLQAAQKAGAIQLVNNQVTGKIIGDSLHIKGVIFNLIENSIKYNTGTPVINISVGNVGERIVITISDNGPGIPEQYHHKIFEKFFRVPSGNKHNTKGHGLGLYYAAEVMRQSGGTIQVKNNSDLGCTFTLSFPQA